MLGSLRSGDWLDAARTRRIAVIMLALSIITIAALWLSATGTRDVLGRPIGTDFSQVWTAGRMVLEGRASEVWDWGIHFREQQLFHGSNEVDVYGWHYPPPFLILAAGLALLPYVPALIVWQAASLGLLARLAVVASQRRDILLFLIGAPVAFTCVTHGHNGFLTAFLLGSGLWLLDRRPFVAGLFFGALVYKPHFAIILPPVLLLMGKWRTIAGAAASSLGLIALTMLIWGWPVWQAFIDSLELTQSIVLEEGQTGFYKIMSGFAAVRAFGGSVGLAYAAQALVTLGALAATLWVTAKGRPDLRNAAIATSALLVTPYLLDYDLVVLLVAIFFLWRDAEAHGWLTWEKSALGFAWAIPLVARIIAQATYVPVGFLTMVMVLALTVRRVTASPSRHSRAASAP